MSHKLTIKAFFFNAKTDYLPYYKHFTITTEDDATAKDMLALIQEQNENFSYPKQHLVFKINGLVVEAKESVSKIVERLGNDLQIDPVSSYRSKDGLKINDSDFMKSYEFLAPYASESDAKYYKTLYALHYASESENYNRDYIGDAVLVLAHKMLSEGSEHEEEILAAISNVHSGLFDCEYENNLFNAQDHTASIESLKKLANPEDGPSLCSLIMQRLTGKEKVEKEIVVPERKVETIDDLENKTVAFYGASAETTSRVVNFSRATKLAGLSIIDESKEMALKKVGITLLEAFDSSAEVLVIENVDVLNMIKDNFSTIENLVGRKMIGFEFISLNDFTKQTAKVAA